jgi:protein-tyrosine phosphatase
MTGDSTADSISIESVPNLRDIGGWQTVNGGMVRSGLLYRSAALSRLEVADEVAFGALGIRSIYDLRTWGERSVEPDRLPPRTEYVEIDVLEDSTGLSPARLIDLVSDPKAAEKVLGGGKALSLFRDSYREMVSLPSALSGYGRFFDSLSSGDNLPALLHCTTGKDRTGWAAASFLMLLGVPDDLVMREYLLTNELLVPALQPLFELFLSAGVDPEVLLQVIGVRREYLEAALEEMLNLFGTVEGYFMEGLGLGNDKVDILLTTFVAKGLKAQ